MLSAKQKAEADNTYRDLDYLGYHKKPSLMIVIHCFEENNEKQTVAKIEPVLILL